MKSGAAHPSLGTRVLRDVMVPLGLTWVAGALVALLVAQFFNEKAFDRSLLDDAYVLASNVKMEGAAFELTLTEREMASLLFDQVESLFFSVRGADGRVVAGEAGLNAALSPDKHVPQFSDIEFKGMSLRAVTLYRDSPAPLYVTVAETRVGRVALLRQLLLYSLGPQALLLVLLTLWVRRRITQDLLPLSELQRAVDDRGANALAPVPVSATTREVERLALAINAMLLRLERSVRAQREFAGNVAHELRTPLAGIRALADYGLAQKDPAAWRDQLERIASSQARASRLVDQLLDLALASEAAAGLHLAPVRLDELVREAVLRFLPRADLAGVDLGAVGIDSAVWAQGDAVLIDGILNNLLDNALRYGVDNADGNPSVTVAVTQSDAGQVLSVEDNGASLPGAEQLELMKRGAQGQAGQLLGEGVGLGLALVSQYAALMDARMTLGGGADGRGWRCSVAFAPARPVGDGSQLRDGSAQLSSILPAPSHPTALTERANAPPVTPAHRRDV